MWRLAYRRARKLPDSVATHMLSYRFAQRDLKSHGLVVWMDHWNTRHRVSNRGLDADGDFLVFAFVPEEVYIAPRGLSRKGS